MVFHLYAFVYIFPEISSYRSSAPLRARVVPSPRLCDNMAIVSVLNYGSSKSHNVMHFLRILTREAYRHNFVFSAAHVAGRDNLAANALSRLRLQEFRHLAIYVDQLRQTIPL